MQYLNVLLQKPLVLLCSFSETLLGGGSATGNIGGNKSNNTLKNKMWAKGVLVLLPFGRSAACSGLIAAKYNILFLWSVKLG